MKDEGSILDELVKAKENIKRKYIALKTGEANVQQLMSQTFKPIIDPLTKISNTTESHTSVICEVVETSYPTHKHLQTR